MNCSCKYNPNRFCYISGHVVSTGRAEITDFVKKTLSCLLWIQNRTPSEIIRYAAKHVLKTCGIGVTRNGRVCHLANQ